MKINIIEKKTGQILETKEVKNLKSFMFYWTMQCDTKKYTYKIVQ